MERSAILGKPANEAESLQGRQAFAATHHAYLVANSRSLHYASARRNNRGEKGEGGRFGRDDKVSRARPQCLFDR